jgi:multidrug efflux pump subunit AcrA (membrane-fusion protein)
VVKEVKVKVGDKVAEGSLFWVLEASRRHLLLLLLLHSAAQLLRLLQRPAPLVWLQGRSISSAT